MLLGGGGGVSVDRRNDDEGLDDQVYYAVRDSVPTSPMPSTRQVHVFDTTHTHPCVQSFTHTHTHTHTHTYTHTD